MSKGGGTTVTNNTPWTGAQPHLLRAMDALGAAFRNPPDFYPNRTFVGPMPMEIYSWGNRQDYADRVFGGSPAPFFGDAVSALQFGLSNTSPAGRAGDLDASAAIRSMLSGRPDYTGFSRMANAANANVIRQFENNILPGLNRNATFMRNPTGAIKEIGLVLPELGQRMAESNLNLWNSERNRAFDDRRMAAGLVSSLGQAGNAQALDALRLFPLVAQTGATPGELDWEQSQWMRGFAEKELGENIERWNFAQNQPMNMAQWYLSNLQGTGALGGQSTTDPGRGSPALGALGGGLGGATLARMMNLSGPAGWAAVGLGSLLGALG
jgi:hypothetical protein